MSDDLLESLGVIGLMILIGLMLLIPLICTIVIGTYIATMLGLTGLVWWSFVILFWIGVSAVLAMINRIGG